MQVSGYKAYLILLFISLQFIVYSQDLIIGGGTTISTYFGDLAPYNLKQSWAEIHPGVGVYVSKKIWKRFYFEVDAEQSTISATDKNSASEARKARNLSFKSPITSLSASMTMRLGLLKYNRLGIYGGAGASIFRFDPKAQIDGKWYRLRPLGTEGQGLDGARKPYPLVQTAIPLQAGVYFRVKPKLFLEIEITHYLTATDYLDDVSGANTKGDFFDSERLIKEKDPIVYRLADRSKEVNPNAPDNFKQGIVRGNPQKNDEFSFIKIGFAYSLQKVNKNVYTRAVRIKCPEISKDWFVNTTSGSRRWH